MSAREDILQAIRSHKPNAQPSPAPYLRKFDSDRTHAFISRARAANTTVIVLNTPDEALAAISQLLRERNLTAKVHFPETSELEKFDWKIALEISHAPPGPDDAAVSIAPIAVAETGTLVFPSNRAPASWHFRPGFEIALLREENIVPDLETAFAQLRDCWPPTINLVTGPSRTADIEQTLELGAHGPKALAVLLIRARH